VFRIKKELELLSDHQQEDEEQHRLEGEEDIKDAKP
jgi:hypothetical protein